MKKLRIRTSVNGTNHVYSTRIIHETKEVNQVNTNQKSTMWRLCDERHRLAISLCDALCLERESEISSEVHLLHSSERTIRRIMDTVHAVSNR